MAKFTGERFITRGIEQEISFELLVILWGMIDFDIAAKRKMDYLQIFKLESVLSNRVPMQEITHIQEVPKRENKSTVKVSAPVTAKIYVIGSEDYVTMLFASEY